MVPYPNRTRALDALLFIIKYEGSVARARGSEGDHMTFFRPRTTHNGGLFVFICGVYDPNRVTDIIEYERSGKKRNFCLGRKLSYKANTMPTNE